MKILAAIAALGLTLIPAIPGAEAGEAPRQPVLSPREARALSRPMPTALSEIEAVVGIRTATGHGRRETEPPAGPAAPDRNQLRPSEASAISAGR